MAESRQITVKTGGNGLIYAALGLGAVYMAYTALKPVVAAKKLAAYVTRFRVYAPSIKFKGDNFILDTYIQNVNSYPITVAAVVGDIWIMSKGQSYKLANVAKYDKVVIKPTAETKFSIPARERFLGFLPYFQALLGGKIKGQSIMFIGHVNINNKVYPVKESLRISR